MKTLFQRLPIYILTTVFMLATSCSNDSDELIIEEERSIFELLTSKTDNSNLRQPKKGDDTITEIALNSEDFEELVKALVYVDAGLVELFLGNDQYTVFAPNDAAFMNLYAALGVDGITDLPQELVLNVLLYHVTDGRRAANSVVPKRNLKTIETLLEGATFNVNPDLEILAVGNTANIVAPNISASNGIIHVIDEVLLPINP